MSKSQPDFNLILTRPGGLRLRVDSWKEGTFKVGQVVAAQVSGREVVFNAIGAGKPEFSFAVVDGDEVVRVRRFVMNPRTGKPWQDVQATWTGRRDEETISYRFEECTCAEGGGVKTTEGEGFTAESAFKLLPLRAKESVNGAAYRRCA